MRVRADIRVSSTSRPRRRPAPARRTPRSAGGGVRSSSTSCSDMARDSRAECRWTTVFLGRRGDRGGPSPVPLRALVSTSRLPHPAQPARVPPGPPRSRDPFFDNAKCCWSRWSSSATRGRCCRTSATSTPAYIFLYLCHVPAFVLVTGYLSRSFTFTRANLRKLVTTIVVPYLLFETRWPVPDRPGRRELRGALHQPALADVVPHRAVPVAAGHPAAHPASRTRCRSRSRSAWSAG